MDRIIYPRPLYLFLQYCNETNLERLVLDCGAGGSRPPLSLFYEFGYQTHGIEYAEEQLMKARAFAEKEEINLQLIQGDMCELPYKDASFNFLYSWNTTVHMQKQDVRKALREFERVVRPKGLCYINFLTHECDTYGVGNEVRPGEFEVLDQEGRIQFSHYAQWEIEEMISGFEVLYREDRVITRIMDGRERHSGFYDYILKKKSKVE